MLRVVLDTNVLVSAIISDGKSRQLFKKGINHQFSIITSDLILKELADVLSRPKFKISKEELEKIIYAMNRSAETVTVQSKLNLVKEDPKDNMVIETACDGNADIIVSGDGHILALQTYGKIRIVTVQKMLDLI